jgi:hypothetical protein
MDKKSFEKLNWISDDEIIDNSNIKTKIIGTISFNNSESDSCEDVIFLNKYTFHKFSPFFEYTLKTTEKYATFYPKVKNSPSYLNNPFSKMGELWAMTKFKNYIVVGINNKRYRREIFTWNEITRSVCNISFNQLIIKHQLIIVNHDPCDDAACGCHNNILKKIPKYPKKTQVKQSFSDTLLSLLCLDYDYEVVDFEIIQESNNIVFMFEKMGKTNFAIFKFEAKANKIIIDQNKGPYIFSFTFVNAANFVFKNGYLYVTSCTCETDDYKIIKIKWFSVLFSLSYNFDVFKRLEYCPSSMGTTTNNLLLTFQKYGNCFGYELIKL